MQASSECLYVRIVQPIILGYFKAKAPFILKKINVTLQFIHKFMHELLDWNFQHPTIAHGKLPNDWEIPRTYMT
jgi:hypothetical protein